MSVNKKYYYLKLKDNFFDREEIKILEHMENGFIYSNLYLKLCLMSLKGDGRLLFRDEIPYDESMIATITNIPLDNVRVGINILQKMKLISQIESGEIYMREIQSMIGHGSTEAERMAESRKNGKSEQCSQIVYQRLETRDKRLEIKDRPDKLDKTIEMDTNFITLYNAYPRHLGKVPAYKAYTARIKEGVSHDTLLIAVKNYAADVERNRTDEKYIMHPATFLGPSARYADYSGKKEVNQKPELFCPECAAVISKNSFCWNCARTMKGLTIKPKIEELKEG